MRVGPCFKEPCEPVMLCNIPLSFHSFVSDVKYLGVCLVPGLKFKVSLCEIKRKFFVIQLYISQVLSCCAYSETVVLQVVNSYWKSHLYYMQSNVLNVAILP